MSKTKKEQEGKVKRRTKKDKGKKKNPKKTTPKSVESVQNTVSRANINLRDKKINAILNPPEYADTDTQRFEIIVPDNERMSSSIMTHAEYTRVVSERAQQIENGSPIFVYIEDESNPINIAKKEIDQKKCPLEIIRYMSNDKKYKEIWMVKDMIVPFK